MPWCTRQFRPIWWKTYKIAKWNVSRSQNRPTSRCRPSIPSWKHPTEKKEKQEDTSVTDPLATLHYREKESQDELMDRHKNVEIVKDNEIEKDWRDKVIGEKYTKKRQEVLDTLAEFMHMWDGCLGQIDKVKHCIKQTSPDVHPVNFCTLSRWTESTRVSGDGNRQNATCEGHGAFRVKMGFTNRMFANQDGSLRFYID